MQEPVDVAHDTREGLIGAHVHHRWAVAAVEPDAVIGLALDDASDAESCVGGGNVRLLQELEMQPTDLNQSRPVERGVGVLDLELASEIPRETVAGPTAQVCLVHPRTANWKRQYYERVTQRGRDVQWSRKRVAPRTVKWRSVWKAAPGHPDRELA